MELWRKSMQEVNRKEWIALHQNKRYRPKYPSETVVQFVFRNFERNGITKVLDLGCGAGRHVFFLGNENIVPYGIDFSDEGIDYTKELLKHHGMEKYADNMEVGSLTKLPYVDNYFDGIICYGVLYYLDIQRSHTSKFGQLAFAFQHASFQQPDYVWKSPDWQQQPMPLFSLVPP